MSRFGVSLLRHGFLAAVVGAAGLIAVASLSARRRGTSPGPAQEPGPGVAHAAEPRAERGGHAGEPGIRDETTRPPGQPTPRLAARDAATATLVATSAGRADAPSRPSGEVSRRRGAIGARGIAENAVSALAFLLLALALALVGLVVVYPRATGSELVVVRGGSMDPVFRAGDAIAIHAPVGPILPGTIITFATDGNTLITHRVIEVEDRGGEARFITRGDANDAPDDHRVAPQQVRGVYQFRVPYLGYAAHEVRQPLGWLVLLIGPAVLLLAGEMRALIRLATSRQKLARSAK